MIFSQVCYQLTVTLAGVIVGKVWKESTTSFTLFEESVKLIYEVREGGLSKNRQQVSTGFLHHAGMEEQLLVSSFSPIFSQKKRK